MIALVAGYFDGLTSGHVAFLRQVAQQHDLWVGVGTDRQMMRVKATRPLHGEAERLFMVANLKCVVRAVMLRDGDWGLGNVSWRHLLDSVDMVVAGDDLDPEIASLQQQACREAGAGYVLLPRSQPYGARSSSDARGGTLPGRVVLTTGADQMSLSKLSSGLCVGFSIEGRNFDDRSGMATSSRRTLGNVFGGSWPGYLDPLDVARIAFAVENEPTTRVEPGGAFPWGSFAPRYVTGSVDPISLCLPGLSVMEYSGGPWPRIENTVNDEVLDFLEANVRVRQTQPRPRGEHYVLEYDHGLVQQFTASTYAVRDAVSSLNAERLGLAMTASCLAFARVCPTYHQHVKPPNDCLGYFIQGAGHGGYMAVVGGPGERVRVRRCE